MKKPFYLGILLFGLIPNLAQAAPKVTLQVESITFTGNQKIPTAELKSHLITKEGSVVHPANGVHEQKQFANDVEILNSFYFNEGYVQARVEPPKIETLPEQNALRVTFKVNEGEQFKVGKVAFDGNWPVPHSELLETTRIQKQNFFRYQVLQDDLRALQDKCGDVCELIPRTRIREADREVDITFEVAKVN